MKKNTNTSTSLIVKTHLFDYDEPISFYSPYTGTSNICLFDILSWSQYRGT